MEHSNDLTLRDYGRRLFDETVGLRRAGLADPRISFAGAVYRAVRRSVGDGIRIIRDPDLSFGSTVFWLLQVPPCTNGGSGTRCGRGGGGVELDDAAVARGSLEARRRS